MMINDSEFQSKSVHQASSYRECSSLPDSEEITLAMAACLLERGDFAVTPGTRACDAWVIADPRLFDGQAAIVDQEKTDTCHANCFERSTWDAIHHIGYALSEDGLWHEHSWLVKDGRAIETTGLQRILYVGVPISRLPRETLPLLHGESVDSADWHAHEAMERETLKDVSMKDVFESRSIIESALQRRTRFTRIAA